MVEHFFPWESFKNFSHKKKDCNNPALWSITCTVQVVRDASYTKSDMHCAEFGNIAERNVLSMFVFVYGDLKLARALERVGKLAKRNSGLGASVDCFVSNVRLSMRIYL